MRDEPIDLDAEARRATVRLDPAVDRLHVALLGLMGVGKSTIGRELAAKLDRPFLDNDTTLEAAEHANVVEIAAAGGEAAVRDAEAAVLQQHLALVTPSVLAVAAGTVLSPENRELLRLRSVVVWLTAPVSVLMRRIEESPQPRPWVGNGALTVLTDQLRERTDLYGQVATVVVDVSRQSPTDNAETIARRLSALRPRT